MSRLTPDEWGLLADEASGSETRLWRALVRIERRKSWWHYEAYVFGWDPSTPVYIHRNDIPRKVRFKFHVWGKKYFHAWVNIGAEKASQLRFEDWETS